MNQSPSSETTYVYLIRHGATEANERRPNVLQGAGIDLPLSERGRQQAAAVGRFLRDIKLGHVYTSPLVRAVETGQAVAEHHGQTVSTIPELAECNVGKWEGMDWDSISKSHPREYRSFMENPFENAYLEGESYGDVLRRTEPVFDELLKRHAGESIAVVAHNVVNRVYLARLLGLDLRLAKELRQSNGGINLIRRRDGRTDVMTLNAFFHLEEKLR